MVNVILEGVLDLHGAYPVKASVLGSNPAVLRLGQYEIHLHPPRKPQEMPQEGVRHSSRDHHVEGSCKPPLWEYPAKAIDSLDMELSSLSCWGYPIYEDNEEEFWVAGLRFAVTGSTPTTDSRRHELTEKVWSELEAWVHNFRYWLEAATGCPIREASEVLEANECIAWSSDKWSPRYSTRHSGIQVHKLEFVSCISSGQWAAYASLATHGPPSLPWCLLADAEALRVQGEPRRAIVEAATAAEIGIATFTSKVTAMVPENFQRLLQSKFNGGMGRALYALKTINMPCWSDWASTEKLIKSRNLAVHQGDVGTQDVRELVRTARDILSHCMPLVSNLDTWASATRINSPKGP
jgi:hypothetical protein